MKILMIGDTLFDVEGAVLDNDILEVCAHADLVIMNLEGPVTSAPAAEVRPRPLSQPNAIRYLQDIGVDVAILANNHIMDHGPQGLADTRSALQANGIRAVGVGDSNGVDDLVVIRRGPESIALLAFAHKEGPMFRAPHSYGPVPLPDAETIASRIKALRDAGHVVVVSYHGGEEFFSVPWPRRRGYLRWLRHVGADLVFAHHAHTVQPIEYDLNGSVIYGAGNFLMDTPYQRMHAGTDRGYMVEYDTVDKQIGGWLVRFDRQRRVLMLDSRIPGDSIRLYQEDDLGLDTWSAECRAYMLSPARIRSSRAGLLFPLVFVLRSFFRRSLRDRDIVMGAIPLIGKMHAKRAYRMGREGCFDW